jgi:putative membrane protein
MMHWYGGGMDWLGWLFGWPTMRAFWAIVVAAVIAVLRVGGGLPRTDHRTPEQLLDERLARGQIDVEDYTRRRDMLGAGRKDSAD